MDMLAAFEPWLDQGQAYEDAIHDRKFTPARMALFGDIPLDLAPRVAKTMRERRRAQARSNDGSEATA